DDARAAHRVELGDGDVDDAVERVDDALQRATSGAIDDGLSVQHDYVAGGDDIRRAEEDDQITVRVSRGLVDHLDRLAGDEERLLRSTERISGQYGGRHRRRSVLRVGQ